MQDSNELFCQTGRKRSDDLDRIHCVVNIDREVDRSVTAWAICLFLFKHFAACSIQVISIHTKMQYEEYTTGD